MTDNRKHFECVLHLATGGRRVVHEYGVNDTEARELAWETVSRLGDEVLSIDITEVPTVTPAPGAYELECYSCGLRGTNADFGSGNNRQCPSCGSYAVHAP